MKQDPAPNEVDVLVAGGGPVGMALACELGRRGISAHIVEAKAGFHEHPRSTVVGARTMEFFRSWGIDQDVAAHAVPGDYPLDVAFTLKLTGEEFGRLQYPTINDASERSAKTLEQYPPLEWSRYAKMVIGQNLLEPVLFRGLHQFPTVTTQFCSEVLAFVDLGDHVEVEVGTESGPRQRIVAKYLVGCDGGRSVVRKSLGKGMSGTGDLGESVNIFFRAPNFLETIGKRPAFLFWTFASGATGSFIAIDGKETWVHSRHLLPGETYEGFDPVVAIQKAVGAPIDIEIISHWPWIPRELVANEYARGRVFLAGDAAHLMSPTGGQGLNTGVGDAVNLAWKIQADLEGWAGPGLLETYETERRSVAVRNSGESTDNRRLMRISMLAGGRLDQGDEADQAREEIISSLPAHAKHFDSPGITFGDDYDQSPIVVADGTPPVVFDPLHYVPSARPGRRLPHVWVEAGVSIFDVLGPDFNLIHLIGADVSAIENAFAHRKMGLNLVALDGQQMVAYGASLVLVRPDGHVAWRGETVRDASLIVDIVRGALAEAGSE